MQFNVKKTCLPLELRYYAEKKVVYYFSSFNIQIKLTILAVLHEVVRPLDSRQDTRNCSSRTCMHTTRVGIRV